MPVHKKHEEKPVDAKPDETKTEPVVVSDVITETIEVVEKVVPQVAKSEMPAESSTSTNPLDDFKKKMVEEEMTVSDGPQKKNYMWPILFIFIIAILLLTGIFLYKRGANINNEKINVVKLSPAPTVVPEPTKTIDLTKYEIEILNGSSVSGEASRQKESLTAEGFTISSVGNADNSDYTDTIIKAKAEVDKNFITKLKNVLSASFTVGETESLSDDSSVPVVVIIGTKK